MKILKSEASTYLLHRIGAIIAFAGTSLFVIFFTANQRILNEAIGRAYFFWAWGLIMTAIPLIVGLSWRDTLKCLLFIFPIMGTVGALAFVLPAEALPDFLSILTIVLILVMIFLKRSHRKSVILDLRPKISQHALAESLAIFAISWVCASMLQFLGMTSSLIGSSVVTAYLFLWTIFFTAISMIIALARVLSGKVGRRKMSNSDDGNMR
jgi:hypothetical protein